MELGLAGALGGGCCCWVRVADGWYSVWLLVVLADSAASCARTGVASPLIVYYCVSEYSGRLVSFIHVKVLGIQGATAGT